MAGEIDALADLGTAALIADSLDPPRSPHAPSHGACANCGTPLHGAFCGACGQKAHFHRSLADVGHEFLHGITHFDGKAWTTLPMLLFRPGRLTRDYIMGKRARYIAPVPLFLLVVFLMFFVFSFAGTNNAGPPDRSMTRAEAVAALPNAEAAVVEIDAEIARATAAGQVAEARGLALGRTALIVARDRIKARAAGDIARPLDIVDEIRQAEEDGRLRVSLGRDSFNAKARKALKNIDLVLYKIQGKAYKLSFLLVPLSLPWLWLLFAWKRGVRMYDHAVFALYSISFMSLVFVVGSIALTLGVDAGAFWFGLLFVVPVAHMFTQLKGAYALSTGSAAWRTAALSFAAVITLALYAALMIALGILD